MLQSFIKKEHYTLCDEFIKKYQQLSGGYIEYARKVGKVIDRSLAEPNQKWHLLEAYYGYKEKEGKLDLEAETTIWDINWQRGGLLCPELLLWIAEAAGCNIEIAKQEAENLCHANKRKEAHKKIKELIPWEIIENNIKKLP